MKVHERYCWLTLPVLLLMAGPLLADPNWVTECGTELTEPGHYKLKGDLLNCPEDGVLISGSDITLDMKGHEISCMDTGYAAAGVKIKGPEMTVVRNVTVQQGHVTNCNDGILLIRTEDSKVTHMTSSGNRTQEGRFGTGIVVWFGSNNVITHNHTFDNEGTGIGSWESSGNLFKHNTSYGNVNAYGIYAELESNSRIMCNTAYGNLDGIWLGPESTGNLLRGNFASDNMFTGIGMMGYAWDGYFWLDIPTGNTIRSNIAENNPWGDFWEVYYDVVTGDVLFQPEGLCLNTWEKNQFLWGYGPEGCFGIPVELDEDDVCALDDD